MTGLILAGSYEARDICEKLYVKKIPAIASLSGVTKNPLKLALKTHIGGFGGVTGFKDFIQKHKIKWVINATHPFASTMRNTSISVCNELNINHLIIQRPEWISENSDEWHYINSINELDSIIPIGANVFIGTGRNTLNQYSNMGGRKLLCRVIDEPDSEFPFEGGRYLIGNPPFSIQEEVSLFIKNRIEWVVAKNSGGSGGFSKIIAARKLNLAVVLLNRPIIPSSNSVKNVDEAMIWLSDII